MSAAWCRPARATVGLSLAVLLLASLGGCASESAPVTAEKSKYRAAGSTKPAAETTEAPAKTADDAPDTAVAPPPDELATNEGKADSTPAPDATPSSRTAEDGPRPGAKGVPNRSTSTATIAVPDTDNPKELWQFMQELEKRQPRGTSRAEQLEDFRRIQTARLAAGERILATETDEQTKLETVQAMQEIYSAYMQFQLPGAAQELRAFADRMAKREDRTLSQYGKLLQFQLRFSQLVSQPTTQDEDILEEIQGLLDQYKDAPPAEQQNAMFLAAGVTDMLEQNGMREVAVKAQRLIAAEIKKNKDPEIARQAELMESRANVTEANLQQLANDLLTRKEGAEEQLTTSVEKLLKGENPSIAYVGPLQEVGQLLELTGNVDAARTVFTSLAEAYKDHENKRVAEIVGEMTGNALKRLDLIGKPFELEGVTRDGQPFDWPSYRGKVVLVDFWATWSNPSLQAVSNILENYRTFRDEGFEVVGVNLNVDLAEYDQFEKLQKLPWPSVFSQSQLDGEKVQSWAELPLAKKYGVDAIPFTVLVDRDGKVDSLHVHGPRLAARLGKLLAEGDAKPASNTKSENGEEKTDEQVPPAAEGSEKSSSWNRPGARFTNLLFGAVFFDPAEGDEVADKPVVDTKAQEPPKDVNPYAAKPGLSAAQLETWLEKMLDKPKTIQSRPGFTEAVADACDRLLAMEPKPSDSALLLAVETKLQILHQAACRGDDTADEQLVATVMQFENDERKKVARLIEFYQAERKALDGEASPLEKVPETLAELKAFFEKEKLAARHLRMASATVALINRLEDGDEREKHFEEFGKTFATSTDKELARYGRKLAKKPAVKQSDLVGKELQLDGITAQGVPLAWNTYRGKVVVVDFWATWCGPCLKELPNVIATYEKHKERGFEVLGVSVDKDLEALAAFLEQKPLPWPTLAGEETEALATKYGVRGIPTLMLVDREGKVVAVAHRIQELEPQIEKLLGGEAKPAGE